MLLQGKLVFRFPAGSFTNLAARGRALLAEVAIRARMFLGTSLTARGVEKTLILGYALECFFRVGHPFPPNMYFQQSLPQIQARGNRGSMRERLERREKGEWIYRQETKLLFSHFQLFPHFSPLNHVLCSLLYSQGTTG